MKLKEYLESAKKTFDDFDYKKSKLKLTRIYTSTGCFILEILLGSLQYPDRKYKVSLHSDRDSKFEIIIILNLNGEIFHRKIERSDGIEILNKRPSFKRKLDRFIKFYLKKFKNKTYKRAIEYALLPQGEYVYDCRTFKLRKKEYHSNTGIFGGAEDFMKKFQAYSLEVALNDQKIFDKIRKEISEYIDDFAKRVGFIE